MSAAAERAVGDLLIALFPTVHVTGKGLPLGSESGFGVPPWWQWCLRWGHAWLTEAGGGVCAHPFFKLFQYAFGWKTINFLSSLNFYLPVDEISCILKTTLDYSNHLCLITLHFVTVWFVLYKRY